MNKSTIIRICQGQPELALRIVQPGCGGGQLIEYERIRMVIQAPHCEHRLKSPLVFNGCWPGFNTPWRDSPPPHELPALIYPAFDTNEYGETVFRFDDKLYALPPGRYFAFIEFTNGTLITRLDLDLCNSPFLVDTARVTEEPCTTKGSCS